MSKQRGPTTFGKIFGGLWYLIVCFIILAAGSLYGWARRSPLVMGAMKGLFLAPKPTEAFSSNVVTFLILGCDEDLYYQHLYVAKHAARSDMMMVARMDFETNEITGVSIPRDTWCKLPGYDTHKINAYHAIAKFGQENELTQQAVEHLIGVKIDKVITIDYRAFQKMVDMVGGVSVSVAKQMDYDDNAGQLHVHFKPGKHKLNGYDAMAYVRYRHSNKGKGDTDFERQARQKDLLVGLKQAVFANFTNLPEIAEASKGIFGGALSDEQILALAFFSKGVGEKKIKIGTIPTVEDGNGLKVDEAKLPSVLAQYKLAGGGSRVSQR